MPAAIPRRPRSTLAAILALWAVFYASFALFSPPLLDDADSVHAEVAREMLLRHDYVTLYANGIRYLEKAPLLYWSMALTMKIAALLHLTGSVAMTVAVRIPNALAMLALALVCETFARRLFSSVHAGLYAALIVLSSFGMFLFTRITLPDAFVCLWLAVGMLAYLRMDEEREPALMPALIFAVSCALSVLSKGLIGLVFPALIIGAHLWITHGWKRGWKRLGQMHLLPALLVFLAIAAPWHILAGLANPTVGHPTPFRFVNGHWRVPLPTDGNVRGWFWFYFMNEHVLRYLNLRVPHDYDTSPLWLFWGLCLVWIMPWSAFAFKAVSWAVPWRNRTWHSQFVRRDLPAALRGRLLLICWIGVVLLFFSLSTRQEYYVLPALPGAAILIAGWLSREVQMERDGNNTTAAASILRAGRRCTLAVLIPGAMFAIGGLYVLIKCHAPAPGTDLATLLSEHPKDYALSMGHFLDLDMRALGMFRLSLTVAVLSLFVGPLAAFLLRRRRLVHPSNLALAAGAFGFLLAAWLGFRTFSPVLTSAQLARAIAPEVKPQDMVAIHGEYETGSTLGFDLKRNNIHILQGRSSNLWYGSFFPDAPKIFETPESFAAKWSGPQRIFLWQSLTDPPNKLPPGIAPVYVIARGGGKEIISNQHN